MGLLAAILPGLHAPGSGPLSAVDRVPAAAPSAVLAADVLSNAPRSTPPATDAPPPAEPDEPVPPPPPPPAPIEPAPVEVAIQPPPADLSGPVAVASPPPSQLADVSGRGGGVWAVIIGIDDYPGRAYDLHHAVSDADAVDQALARFGVTADRRLVLRDGQADRATVLAAATWLVERAGPDATAILFYAGHVRHLGGETQALVTAEGGLITDHELALRLAGLTARQAWFMVAACYGGGFTELLAPGRVLTAAADSRSLAYENRAIGGSYLVHYMVREGWLEGRAGPSVQAAFEHADRRLAADHPNRRPVQFDHGDRPIVLSDSLSSPSQPASAPAPSRRPRPRRRRRRRRPRPHHPRRIRPRRA